MAYGYRKSTYSKSTSRGRGRISKRTRFARNAVPVPKKRRVSHVRKNALAINKIARVQRTLKNMTYGSVQTGYHIHVPPTTDSGLLLVTRTTPLLFDMTDFTRHTAVDPGNGAGIVNRFGCRIYTLGYSTATPPAPFASVHSYFQRNQGANPFFPEKDIVDGGCYKPLYGEYFMKFTGTKIKQTTTVTITTFVVRTNQVGIDPPGVTRHMPNALVNMQNCADPTRNQINGKYFKVYSTKIFKFHPVELATSHGRTFEKLVRMTVKPKGVRKQLDTFPINPNDVSTEPAYGAYGYHQVPQGEPYWCLISTSSDGPQTTAELTDYVYDNMVRVEMSRRVSWRDKLGNSS